MKNYKYFAADFETTVYEGQDHTEVWAAAIVELYTEDVKLYHSIDDLLHYIYQTRSHAVVYFHNLKFDGSFWLDYFLRKGYTQAAHVKKDDQGNIIDVHWYDDKDMPGNSIKYQISHMGQWYSIKVKKYGKVIEFRDSLKLLPFSVKEIGKGFNTKHQKLEMEYEGYRYAGCYISPEEKEYIKNDVLVIKEALEIMFEEGHRKLTIGSCCLQEYKQNMPGANEYRELFPDLTEVPTPGYIEEDNTDAYIRKSYKGGWCYLVPEKANRILKNGCTVDVNSLYPSEMHGDSGNEYPVGYPTFWDGDYIPKETRGKYYFIRVKCRFYLKRGKLPFIQIKGNPFYPPTENLTTSDFYDRKTKRYYEKGWKGKELIDSRVDLTFTMTEYKLFREHYRVKDFEILNGCYFNCLNRIFDNYIDKYKEMKMKSKGARRQIAKLFLNNLYGKLAASMDSSFKYGYLGEDDRIHFLTFHAEEKEAGYIAAGSAITGYTRNFTIRAAQKNYHAGKPGFCYADTDSLHCDFTPDHLVDVPVHPSEFRHWKVESCWDKAVFVRQKTYIEHVVKQDLEDCTPFYDVKGAGMPKHCKDLFIASMTGVISEELEISISTPEEVEFVKKRREMQDFKLGLTLPGKLIPKRIPGGVILVKTTFEIR